MTKTGRAIFCSSIAAFSAVLFGLGPYPAAASPEIEQAEEDHQIYCAKEALSSPSEFPSIDRLVFDTRADAPATLVLCADTVKQAYPIKILAINTALVFLSYNEFEPFWPAAEKRWGSDLSILREEVRQFPWQKAVKSFPYSRMMRSKWAKAIAIADLAEAAFDYDKAVATLETSRNEIMAWKAKREGNTRRDFDLSLVVVNLAAAIAKRDGPSAAADMLDEFSKGQSLAPEYRINVEINQAAYLAEAGRADEALALIEPSNENFTNSERSSRSYAVPGSRREFSWIFGCVHTLRGEPDQAKPYVNYVNSRKKQPVDPYVTWTKSNSLIQLRLAKCMQDDPGFLKIMRDNEEPILSSIWLEFQDVGRRITGWRQLSEEVRKEGQATLASKYRQLPERFWPALNGWQSEDGK